MSRMMEEPRLVGTHSISFEPPSLAVVRLRGPMSEADIRGLREVMNGGAKGHTHRLFLLDLSEAGQPSPEARRYMVHGPLKTPYRGMALFHGSFHTRTMAKLMMAGLSVLARLRDNPVALFGSEAEARAWLLERHRKITREARVEAQSA